VLHAPPISFFSIWSPAVKTYSKHVRPVKSLSVTARITIQWSQFVRCSVYYTPEVNFIQLWPDETTHRVVPLTRKHKKQLHWSPVCFWLKYVGCWSYTVNGLTSPAPPLPMSKSSLCFCNSTHGDATS
jgi:hypothetical protein